MIIELGEKKPVIGRNVFIAPTAVIVGDVEIQEGASIWYGAVLRGDMAPIFIGKNTNVQDNCTIHTDYGKPAHVGESVTIGHNAIVHGCSIEEYCLIGMGAIILNDARILRGSIVAAGSLVKSRQEVGPFHMVAGTPAVFKKAYPPNLTSMITDPAEHYLQIAHEHQTMSRIR